MKIDKFQRREQIANDLDLDLDIVSRLEDITLAIDELVEAKVYAIMRRNFASDASFSTKSDEIEKKQARLNYALASHIDRIIHD
jgi:hypothetical protein